MYLTFCVMSTCFMPTTDSLVFNVILVVNVKNRSPTSTLGVNHVYSFHGGNQPQEQPEVLNSTLVTEDLYFLPSNSGNDENDTEAGVGGASEAVSILMKAAATFILKVQETSPTTVNYGQHSQRSRFIVACVCILLMYVCMYMCLCGYMCV